MKEKLDITKTSQLIKNEENSSPLLGKKQTYKHLYWVVIFILVIVVIVLSIVVGVLKTSNSTSTQSKGPKNVILMISDGFGPTSETLARNFIQWQLNSELIKLPLDNLLIGSSQTRSSSSLITDSAAGATAFSCGIKTTNGYISVDPNNTACLTVLEAAQEQHNMRTGLVVTSRITHATPACFNAHINDREREQDIALQQVKSQVDVMFGGGRCFFLPMDNPESCRNDSKNLIATAIEEGYNVAVNRTQFDSLSELPALALLAPSHMEYDIDRDPTMEPSLVETTIKALELLTNAVPTDNEYGFFLMIEGSRIDHAAHANDPATHLKEILMYQETVTRVKEYVDIHPNTILISVADHECGGLTLGVQLDPDTYPEYAWFPEQLANVTHSADYLGNSILDFNSTNPSNVSLIEYLQKNISREGLGILNVDPSEISMLISLLHNGDDPSTTKLKILYYLGEMVSVRASVGWTTHGHTGVDVDLHAYPDISLSGNHDNTAIGAFIAEYLNLQLFPLT